MSVNAYVGLPGSGKSYGVVENVILPALSKGRHLYTNIPLNMDTLGADFDIELVNQLTNEQIKDSGPEFWLSMPGGAVIVFDEVWRIWPAGMKANDIPNFQKEFLAEHRHKVGRDGLTQEVVLVVQDLSQISAYVRALVDTTYVAVKLDKVGAKSSYRIDVYAGSQKGPKYPKNVVSSFFGKYKPDVYKYYKSHTKSETGLPGMERVIDGRATVWNRPYIKYGFPVAVILLIYGVGSLLKFFNGGMDHKPDGSVQHGQVVKHAPSPSPVLVQAAPSSASVSLKVYSKFWRVVGFSGFDGHWVYHLQHAVKGRRRLSSGLCSGGEFGEPVCEVDGELVTSWTGIPSPRLVDSVPGLGGGVGAAFGGSRSASLDRISSR